MPESGIPVAVSVAWVARIVLGVTFLVSGSGKLRHLDGLVFGILRYQILPARWAWALARPLAALLTGAELGLAVLLLAGIASRLAAVGSLVLVAIFTLAVGVNVRRGWGIPCMCITNSPHERIGRMTLARLGVLAVATIVVLVAPTTVVAGPPGTSVEASFSLLSIATSTTVLLLLMGPAAIVWRDVSAAREAAHDRRRMADQRRRAREQVLARRRARRLDPAHVDTRTSPRPAPSEATPALSTTTPHGRKVAPDAPTHEGDPLA